MSFYEVSLWTAGWLAWTLFGLMLELPAVFNNRRFDTLSELLKWIFGIGQPLTWWRKLIRFAGIAFWAWLPIHIAGYA